MTQKEQIRQEIERRKKVYLTKNGFPTGTFGAIKIETYEGLLAFIDSLPEEIPPYVTGVKGHQDPAGTSDLEEAAGLYLDNHKPLTRYNWGDLQDAFIAGAEWQREQLLKGSPLPEDTVLFHKGVEEGKRLMMEDAAHRK